MPEKGRSRKAALTRRDIEGWQNGDIDARNRVWVALWDVEAPKAKAFVLPFVNFDDEKADDIVASAFFTAMERMDMRMTGGKSICSQEAYALDTRDVTDWPALCAHLAEHASNDDLTGIRRVHDLMTPLMRTFLQRRTDLHEPSFQRTLVRAFNKMITSAQIYEASYFEKEQIPDAAQDIIDRIENDKSGVSRIEIARLNWLLLQTLFGGIIHPRMTWQKPQNDEDFVAQFVRRFHCILRNCCSAELKRLPRTLPLNNQNQADHNQVANLDNLVVIRDLVTAWEEAPPAGVSRPYLRVNICYFKCLIALCTRVHRKTDWAALPVEDICKKKIQEIYDDIDPDFLTDSELRADLFVGVTKKHYRAFCLKGIYGYELRENEVRENRRILKITGTINKKVISKHSAKRCDEIADDGIDTAKVEKARDSLYDFVKVRDKFDQLVKRNRSDLFGHSYDLIFGNFD